MKNVALLFSAMLLIVALSAQNKDSVLVRSIFNEALTHGQSYKNLDYLSNKIGSRLSGSPQAAKAVTFCFKTLSQIKPDTVYLQECMVPHWVRGEKEKAKIFTAKGAAREVKICALGGSIETPAAGIKGEVIEITQFEDLQKLGKDAVKGKIVFFNRPFDSRKISTFDAYGESVDQRYAGPSIAASYGAIATICRSMTPDLTDYPHTGSMSYNDSFPKIPCCALSTNDAEILSAGLRAEPRLHFWFHQTCKTLPDEKSFNVIAEIRGSEHPEEIIVFGGHLDSWDLADGASDDGTGIVQSIEALRLFKTLGIRPKRTIRAVMFMNEENGTRGAKKYAAIALEKKENHILAIETDRGGFSPRGFSTDMSPEKKTKILNWKYLLLPYGIYDFTETGGGSDISPLKKRMNTPLMELVPDPQRYFDIHHTALDKFSMVSKRELELGGAAIASLVYLVSEYGL